ncbi:histone-lysine N-methyltransferase SETMAR [Trichonephila clavipes]|nr:histone-lysine N-methyltransferase SETMAR [Trichonephila clavipes]
MWRSCRNSHRLNFQLLLSCRHSRALHFPEKKRNLCAMIGEGAVTARKYQGCFVNFRLGDFSLKDEPRPGRPSYVSDEVLRGMYDQDKNITFTSAEVGFKLGIYQITALDYIKRLSFVFKLSVWVPHQLSEEHLMDRFSTYFSNLVR